MSSTSARPAASSIVMTPLTEMNPLSVAAPPRTSTAVPSHGE